MQYHHVTFSFGHRAKVELFMNQSDIDTIYQFMQFREEYIRTLGISKPFENFFPIPYVHMKNGKVITSSLHINPDFIQFMNAVPMEEQELLSRLSYSYGDYVEELLAHNKPILVHISYGDFR